MVHVLLLARDLIEHRLYELRDSGKRVMFEGAQGSLLDIDHGTYPYVTSSNTTVGGVCTGAGVGPNAIDYVLGITKAYVTRVGGGPFPTELFDETGERLARRGDEFGATTGRPRRCGWLDAVSLRRMVSLNGVSGLCVTKLDVLDGFGEIKICTAYRLNGALLDAPPLDAPADTSAEGGAAAPGAEEEMSADDVANCDSWSIRRLRQWLQLYQPPPHPDLPAQPGEAADERAALATRVRGAAAWLSHDAAAAESTGHWEALLRVEMGAEVESWAGACYSAGAFKVTVLSAPALELLNK